MRVGINLLYLIPGVVGGTETYARGLVKALADIDPRTEYLLFVNEESRNETFSTAPNVRVVVCPVRALNRARRYAWEQLVLPVLLRNHQVDLVHSLGYVGPIGAPCPHVLTIPDVNFVGHPSMTRQRRAFLRAFVSASARRATHLLTISEFSRQQIHEYMKKALEDITVTHLAGRNASDAGPEAAARLRARYRISLPYVIAFSSTFPHKNIPRLIEAFADVAASHPHSLVLVGHIRPEFQPIIERFPTLVGRVLFTGFVPDKDVSPILAGADLLVFPSLYEGFGLPIIDAQTVGVAVASSNRGSLPEVGGDGAAYFDPESIDDMRQTIDRCLVDAAFRQRLVECGRRNVRRFSWPDAARRTQEVYVRFAATASH
jgi:glycosyltransferase involved in cell wall biosynthesis